MTYMELLNDDRFNYLIDKYFNHEGQGEEYKEYFKHFIENLDKNASFRCTGGWKKQLFKCDFNG